MKVARLLLPLLLAGCISMDRMTPPATSTSLSAPPPQSARFKILQINDVYKIEGLEGGKSGGLARVRTLRTHLQSDGTPVLLLHAGDLLYPSVMSKYLDAKPMIDVMNMLDGDASATDPHLIVTFGNHEFEKSKPDILLARLRESSFQWLSTNTLYCSARDVCTQTYGELAPAVRDLVVADIGGTRVGLFGLLYEMSADELRDKPYVKVKNLQQSARDAVAALRGQGARVVIAITHQDRADDAQLVRDVPGIDVVIGGHDHVFMQDRVGPTWITKADADAKSVVVYDVTVSGSGAVSTTPVRMVLDQTVERDAAVDAVVQRWVGELSTKLGGLCEIGKTKFKLEGVEPAVRGRETALGNMVADVIRQRMGTDIAFINGGGIRINDDIPPGPITNYDLEGIVFYDNEVVAFPLKGSEILEILSNSVSHADAGSGRFLQISGFSFHYRLDNGKYVVSDVRVKDVPLDPAKTYTASTISFLYESGIQDGYEIFTDGRRPKETARVPGIKQLTRDFIRNAKVVEIDVEGRIVRDDAGEAAALPVCP